MAGFGDLMKLMSHAKELQAGAAKIKEELPKMEFTTSCANGGISVTVGGDLTVRKISISPELFSDRDFLESELQAALNSALTSAKSATQDQMREITGALGIDLPSF